MGENVAAMAKSRPVRCGGEVFFFCDGWRRRGRVREWAYLFYIYIWDVYTSPHGACLESDRVRVGARLESAGAHRGEQRERRGEGLPTLRRCEHCGRIHALVPLRKRPLARPRGGRQSGPNGCDGVHRASLDRASPTLTRNLATAPTTTVSLEHRAALALAANLLEQTPRDGRLTRLKCEIWEKSGVRYMGEMGAVGEKQMTPAWPVRAHAAITADAVY